MTAIAQDWSKMQPENTIDKVVFRSAKDKEDIDVEDFINYYSLSDKTTRIKQKLNLIFQPKAIQSEYKGNKYKSHKTL